MKKFTPRISFLILAFLFILASSAYALGRKPEVFTVKLGVDFGSAGKPKFEEVIEVEKGMTPKDAVMLAFSVGSGKSCCSLKEVNAIDGVKIDPAKGLWWICLVNGSKNISPQKFQLSPGDHIEWKYIQSEDKK